MAKTTITERDIEILKHHITYWYEEDQEMPESEIEHIEEMIKEGYSGGELNCLMPAGNTENRGWWDINFQYHCYS